MKNAQEAAAGLLLKYFSYILNTNFITIERFAVELPKVTKSYETSVVDSIKIGCLRMVSRI